MSKQQNIHLTPLPADRAVLTIDSVGFVQRWMRSGPVVRDGWKSWQLMYTIRGQGRAVVEESPLVAQADTIWIMPADRAHRYWPDSDQLPWTYQWIEFSGRVAPEILRMMRLYRRLCVPDCRPAKLIVEELVEVVRARGNAAQHEAASLLMQILAMMEQCLLRNQQNQPGHSGLAEATRTFFSEHLDQPIQLEDVAEQFGVTGCHLVRTFRRQYGVTPMRYLRQLRMNRAKALLDRPEWNITEVGRQVGYPTVQHFSRAFKEVTGLSPREFRRGIVATGEA